jgi:hypothetical protein
MKETNCYSCGVKIYFEDDYHQTLLSTHRTFYCLNGHPQNFVSKTQDQIIIQGLKESMNKYTAQKETELFEKNREIIKLREHTFHCSKCNRFFTSKNNLNRHSKIHENDKRRMRK